VNGEIVSMQRVITKVRRCRLTPIKPTLEPPGIKLLKPNSDESLSNFAFKFNLRRYTKAGENQLKTLITEHVAKTGSPKVRRCRLTLSNPH
jgi:hypothetical protein